MHIGLLTYTNIHTYAIHKEIHMSPDKNCFFKENKIQVASERGQRSLCTGLHEQLVHVHAALVKHMYMHACSHIQQQTCRRPRKQLGLHYPQVPPPTKPCKYIIYIHACVEIHCNEHVLLSNAIQVCAQIICEREDGA
jgi:hypothetical protein